MSELNLHGNAGSSTREVEDALEATWNFIKTRGDLRDISVPLMGTGRGRIPTPRKKMVERIAQSFVDGAAGQAVSKSLTICIRPADAENFSVNLFQIRDYLVQGLH